MIKLAESEIKSISLWTVLIVAMIGGLFAGFLGGGAGYVRMPLLVYVLGVPTKVLWNGPFRSCHLIQLRDNVARDQGKRRYHDCAGDAHRRSGWSADWGCLNSILSRSPDPARVFSATIHWSSPNPLRPHHWASNEMIANHLFQMPK